MNLYLFNDNDSAAGFGVGSYINELTNVLEGTTIHVCIVHLHSKRSEFEIVQQSSPTSRVEHWYIPEVRNRNTFDGIIQDVENYFRNVIYLFRLNIKDTTNLVFHFNFNLCFMLAKRLKEVFECKTVTTVHFMKWALELKGNIKNFHAFKYKPENQRNSFEQFFYTTDEYEGLLYNEVDHVIALSQYTKVLLNYEYQINIDKITVIPNGLKNIKTISETEKTDKRRKLHISEKEFFILFVGRLQAAKGLFYLIKSFRKVLNNIPNCRLIIVGNGDFNSFMKESEDVWANITWTGFIGKKKLYELYAIADIGVLPSLTEQCSYVAIEMMMHGLPMITTSAWGLGEMTEDGVSSLQVPVIEHPESVEIDTELLAEKILFLLQHKEERKRIGENARKRYEEYYSGEIFRRNMLDFYNTLLQRRSV